MAFSLGMRAVYQKDILSSVREAKKLGFHVLEIHLSAPQFFPEKYSAKQRRAIKTLASNYGIVLQTHSRIGQSLIETNGEMRDASKKEVENIVKFSRQIGATCVTFHPGKSSGYSNFDGTRIQDDNVFPKFYAGLFEDSIKHLIKISRPDINICIENTDNFNGYYRKILERYCKTGKVFLTWDLMKNRGNTDILMFFKRNLYAVKNVQISGPNHGPLIGNEHMFMDFLKLLKDKDLPLVIEVLPMSEVVKTKKVLMNII